MRVIPILTALIVAVVLYAVVIERDRLMQFAREMSPLGDETTEMQETSPTETVAEETSADEPASGVVGVMALHSVAQEVDSAVVLRGETQALRAVDVQAETSGKVISDPLRKGTFVEKGQVLCKLDPGTSLADLAEAQGKLSEARARIPETEARIPEAVARVEEARALLQEAQINENAATKLSEGGFASDTRVAGAQAGKRSAEAAVSSAEAGLKAAQSGMQGVDAAIQSAEAAVARAQTEIDRLTIHAPFSGVLETDTAELGSLMQSQGGSALCATILQLDPIKLVGFVPELSVGRVEVGAPTRARLTEGGTIEGQVTFLSRSADSVTRTFRVEITVPNPDLALRAGQTAEIAIQAEGAPAHLVPQSALTLNDDGVLGVRTVDAEGLAEFMPVEVMRDTTQGVLLTGLPDSVNIITVGQEYVTDGVPVAPSYEDVIQ
ncbi:efflux RND transporter periplasmic adaptor subunit [Puniceibacterium sediminis]|uniref:Membrane fusion protein, multidrug efflux system n=1 Tax=Puniceibacterium sediminis TaxID=1608407 RepID=A0A238UXV2_9RHOB|nr:efflux RND transporter periplasmic adaptor subunit [Puniceibacterium sediminis]SNR26990.1 membrane fusion protein, multidrug efflux system [Puniceibacterium sediminis]